MGPGTNTLTPSPTLLFRRRIFRQASRAPRFMNQAPLGSNAILRSGLPGGLRSAMGRKARARKAKLRKAMLRNMCNSLLQHEAIKTTVPKAKELRRVVEPLITLAKVATVANRRLAFARLRDKEAVGTLFTILGPRYANRPGGYLRILKCGFRAGDSAPMAYVELVDRPQASAE